MQSHVSNAHASRRCHAPTDLVHQNCDDKSAIWRKER